MKKADHLIIRPVSIADADALYALIERDRARYTAYFQVTTAGTVDPAMTLAYVHFLMAQAASGETFCHLIRPEGSHDPVGIVFLRSFDRHTGQCEVAYLVSSPHTNKGIATAAVAWAVDEAFRTHGMNKVFARVDPDNIASIRVVEKNGFQREGLLRQDFRTHDGHLLDVIVFGKLR